MKIRIVAWELPIAQGSGPGRGLYGICEGLLAEGHDLRLMSWCDRPPEQEFPDWCEWRPRPKESPWRIRTRALLRPRSDAEAFGFELPDDAVAVADDVMSFAAVRGAPHSVVTMHYRRLLESIAVRKVTPKDVQWMRADRRVAHQAKLPLAYSERVAKWSGVNAVAVPIAFPDYGVTIPPVDEPVAGLLADWSWPPNRYALGVLLDAWPAVREAVAGARLLLAGRSSEQISVGTMTGVELLGAIPDTTDLLAQVGVVAFPCPTSSGPKMKVLEAMDYGVPLVTTPSGIEGVFAEGGAVVASRAGFGQALAALLRDPERRAAVGRSGRDGFLASHAPVPAARLRVAAYHQGFPDLAA